jgi:hypothetical protein
LERKTADYIAQGLSPEEAQGEPNPRHPKVAGLNRVECRWGIPPGPLYQIV